ncbi:unnamed protein product [Lepidochelys olivacea]
MSFIGQQKQKSADGNSVQPGSNFYLDEFENLTDELLFRINAFLQQLRPLCQGQEQLHKRNPPLSRFIRLTAALPQKTDAKWLQCSHASPLVQGRKAPGGPGQFVYLLRPQVRAIMAPSGRGSLHKRLNKFGNHWSRSILFGTPFQRLYLDLALDLKQSNNVSYNVKVAHKRIHSGFPRNTVQIGNSQPAMSAHQTITMKHPTSEREDFEWSFSVEQLKQKCQ